VETTLADHQLKKCHAATQRQQEAQLSQRDRTMLRVIEHFAKSLKIIRNGILKKGVHPY